MVKARWIRPEEDVSLGGKGEGGVAGQIGSLGSAEERPG